MSDQPANTSNESQNKNKYESAFYSEEAFQEQLVSRHRRGKVGEAIFFLSNVVAILMLITLFVHIINSNFGYVVIENEVPPSELANQPLQALSNDGLANILQEQLGARMLVQIRNELSQVPNSEFTTAPVREVLAGLNYPNSMADQSIREMNEEQLGEVFARNLSQGQIIDLIEEEIIRPRVVNSWSMFDSLLNAEAIQQQAADEYPDAEFRFYSWLTFDFITDYQTSVPTTTGLRTALIGSVWIIVITAVTSLLIGVGSAIYLEEYASSTPFSGRLQRLNPLVGWLNEMIEINIRNLAAIPSVIYGMLGLTIFVFALQDVTSGRIFGLGNENGRTVLSGGLTLALLILPIIIVNAQEAIRAVPNSFREASYGLGATKLQTVRQQVLPAAIPGILTGVILALSRAVGETAPLLVVGASTFLPAAPDGPFSKFTVVPIQIYQWTANPDQEFRNVAAAAIMVLLVVMLLLNSTAIILRNRYSRT